MSSPTRSATSQTRPASAGRGVCRCGMSDVLGGCDCAWDCLVQPLRLIISDLSTFKFAREQLTMRARRGRGSIFPQKSPSGGGSSFRGEEGVPMLCQVPPNRELIRSSRWRSLRSGLELTSRGTSPADPGGGSSYRGGIIFLAPSPTPHGGYRRVERVCGC